MKKDQNKERQLSEIFSEIENSLNFISDYPDYIVNQQTSKIRENIKELKQGYKGLRIFILLTVLICIITIVAIVSLIINNDKVNKLNQQLIYKSAPTKFDSIEREILYDKDGNISYMTDDKDRIISYRKIIHQRDSLKDRIILYKDSLSDHKLKLNMASRNYGIYFTEKKLKDNTYITIGSTKFEEMEKLGEVNYKKIKPLVDSINKK